MASPSPASSTDRKIACNICRRRKTACDRKKPCALCEKSNFVCEYTISDRQPGLRAGYVSQLEKRLVELERRVAVVEERPPYDPFQAGSGPDHTANNHGFSPQHVASTTQGHTPAGPSSSSAPIHDGQQQPLPTPALSNSLPLAPKQVTFLDLQSYSIISEACEIWFRKYHRWFPILHQPSFIALVLESGDLGISSGYGPVVQAIVAITLQHLKPEQIGDKLRQDWQDQISASVVTTAVNVPTLNSIQALLILIGDHLGLRHFLLNNNGLAATSPTALRRLPQFVNTIVEQEEKIRAYWMIEMLDHVAAIGARYTVGAALTPGNPLLPCSDSMWAFPEDVMNENHIRPYHYCSAFSLCVILATSELSGVHNFLLKPVMMQDFEQRDTWQSEAQRIDERLTMWRDEFVAAAYRLINAEYVHHDRPEMDPYIVLTNCVLNAAVITLLQQRVPCPSGTEQDVEPWAFASSRCIYAAENTAFKVRQMEEDELRICHPHLIFSIFVAARFYFVHSKALDANVPTNLHSLAFALHTCGKRWPLARTYERIIRIAVAEYRTPIAASTVPKEFFDLKLTTLEITDVLGEWVESVGHSLTMTDGLMPALA
ncbi:hypothetical protein LTR97_011169 [Elasticomyces elasticus]|uniref:Zn(2)-C6 fungal-type domain-containing protein n=1 Tax=Elasticomyces elasticus TaxID=574655 RepID=A0AAN7VXB8_9PEZI|nr:hypothetical protein LTR97_011169 [Elasticomyces elasticus]